MPTARICCLDLDTFFVSVERLHRPELIGQPVVVGAKPGTRGVVTAASYEVRAFGVRSGMPIAEAFRLAPHAIYISGTFADYSAYATRVKTILERFTPIVRTASIDEFFLDFRYCEAVHRHPDDEDDDATIERTVWKMRDTIQAELGLPASAGIGAARPIAKMASGVAKPAGVKMVRVGHERAFVDVLPVRKFPGIGPVTEQHLVAEGIHTLGQLLDVPTGPVRERFARLVESVGRAVAADSAVTSELGRDRPAFHEHDPKGVVEGMISNEQTFQADVGEPRLILDQLMALVERVCWRARKREVRARTITLKLRYSDFQTLSRSRTIAATNTESEVFGCARQLLRAAWRKRRARVRLLGVALSNLECAKQQEALPFEKPAQVVDGAIDAVRERFGYDAIHLGLVKRKSRWLDSP